MRLFNVGTNKSLGATVSLGATRGMGSSTRMFNHCKQNSSNPSGCISQFTNVYVDNPVSIPIDNTVSFLSYSTGRGPGSGIKDTNYGWDESGVWFSGNAGSNADAYPVFTNFTIPSTSIVEVNVDFIYHAVSTAVTTGTDFGLCIYQASVVPVWRTSANITNKTSISYQLNSSNAVIFTGYGVSSGTALLTTGGTYTYTCKFIYNPNVSSYNATGAIYYNGVSKSNTYSSHKLENGMDYRVGFCADNDTSNSKTYITNLTIKVTDLDGTITNYSSSLQNITIPLV